MLPLGDLLDIGDLIRILRLKKGIRGEKEIRKALNTDKDTVSRIERTSRYDPEILDRIAIGLGTSVAELLATRDYLRGSTPAQPRIPGALCPEHGDLQVKLDSILHKNSQMGEWIRGNIITFCAALSNPPPLDESTSDSEGNYIGAERPIRSERQSAVPVDIKRLKKRRVK